MKTIEGNFDNPEVNQLLKKHFIELRSVSPEGSTHVLDIEGLQNKSIKFWSIYENDEVIGCGALKFLDPKHGEFKSIRVADPFRNKGYGKKIIKVLVEKSIYHTNPEEALQVAKDLKSRKVIGTHWGTFVLSLEPIMEPPVRFKNNAENYGFQKKDAIIFKIGEIKPLQEILD